MKTLTKYFLKMEKTEKLAVILEILFVLLLISLIAVLIFIRNYSPEHEHSEFYNDVSENVELPYDSWKYFAIDRDNDNSIIEIDIIVNEDDTREIIRDISNISERLYNYIQLNESNTGCNVRIVFEDFSAGRTWHFVVTYNGLGELDIVYDWDSVYTISLKKIATYFPNVENITFNSLSKRVILDYISDISDFKQLKSITLIGFRFTKDEENYILSVFPECDIIYGEVPPEYLLT